MALSIETPKQLGTIKYQTSNSFSVSIKNTGSSDVNINRVQPGCGSCTTANVANNNIKPGESTMLNVVFRPNSTGTNMPKSITIGYMENGISQTTIFTFISTVVP